MQLHPKVKIDDTGDPPIGFIHPASDQNDPDAMTIKTARGVLRLRASEYYKQWRGCVKQANVSTITILDRPAV